MNEKCRICLTELEKIELINLSNTVFEEKTVIQIIIECAAIEVLNNDPLPQSVCINCLEQLKSFYELRKLISNSDTKLKRNLSENKEIQVKDINMDNRSELCKFKKLSEKNGKLLNIVLQNTEVKDELVESKCLSDFDDNTDNFDKDVSSPDHLSGPDDVDKKSKDKKQIKKPLKKIEKKHECKECNKIFKKAGHYTLHMTKHTGEKKYACEFCPKRFARSYVLVYHRRVHTGERPYTCDICSKRFSSPSTFYIHKKIHTGERNYKCEICDESFILSDSLKIHVRRIHTGERPFLCEICSSAFRSNSSLLTHKQDMHGKKEACSICNKLYSSRVLKEHIRRHKEREQGIKRFACDQCGKRFTCSSSRKKHLLIHSGEKPFSCEICEKSFNQRSALKSHMRVHSDFMPFPCDYCSKSFRYKHHLRSHINTHHKEVVEEAYTPQL